MRINFTKNKYKLLMSAALITVFFFSCSKNDEPQPTPDPALTNVTTATGALAGPKNTVITITGTNFFTDLTKIQVFVNGKDCEVLSATSTIITAKIPPACGSGKIELVIDGKRMEGPEFVFENTYTVSSYTNGLTGIAEGPVATAKIDEVDGISIDKHDNKFIGQYAYSKIWKIDANGNASIFAGSGSHGTADGNGTAAQLTYPEYTSVGPDGNLYVADDVRIRKIDPQGNVTTIFNAETFALYGIKAMPGGIYTGTAGNLLKISYDGQVLWHIKSKSSSVGLVDGDTSIARFNMYGNIEVDSTEQNVYFPNRPLSTNKGWQIRKLDLQDMTITTIAGIQTIGSQDGPAMNASFNVISDLRFDKAGSLWIADTYNNRVRLLKDGIVSTVIGQAGPGDVDGDLDTAKVKKPCGLAFDSKGSLYVSCWEINKIKKMVID